MDDYAKARHKATRKLLVLKIVTEQGTMNPLMSSVDFVQDGDLNKSLEHFVSILTNKSSLTLRLLNVFTLLIMLSIEWHFLQLSIFLVNSQFSQSK